MQINVFDFDKTIYAGDSMLDFYAYSVRRKPTLLRYMPTQLWHIMLYLLKLESKTRMKSGFLGFVRGIPDASLWAVEFWNQNIDKIKPWYRRLQPTNVVVISASPAFLLEPLKDHLPMRALIATDVDPHTGEIKGLNCYGGEKVARLAKALPTAHIVKAYSDSLSDVPLLKCADQAYLVKGENVVPFHGEAHPSKSSSIW